MNTTTKLFFAIAAVSAVPALAACGGADIGAGKFAEYRIAFSPSQKFSGNTATCSANPLDKTTFETGNSWLIYGLKGDSGDDLKLDTGVGGVVLDGSKQDDGSYTFKGVDTALQTQGGTTFTTVTSSTVTFTVSGETLTGDSIGSQSTTCSGQCNGFSPTQCAVTSSFVGVAVENAQAPDPHN